MTAVRGIRGATTAESDTRDSILDATEELLHELSTANDLDPADIASALFTVTPDIRSEFPQIAARARLGWVHVALLGATEMPVPGDAERCIRVLLLVNSDKRQDEMNFVYLHGASNLRARGINETD